MKTLMTASVLFLMILPTFTQPAHAGDFDGRHFRRGEAPGRMERRDGGRRDRGERRERRDSRRDDRGGRF